MSIFTNSVHIKYKLKYAQTRKLNNNTNNKSLRKRIILLMVKVYTIYTTTLLQFVSVIS